MALSLPTRSTSRELLAYIRERDTNQTGGSLNTCFESFQWFCGNDPLKNYKMKICDEILNGTYREKFSFLGANDESTVADFITQLDATYNVGKLESQTGKPLSIQTITQDLPDLRKRLQTIIQHRHMEQENEQLIDKDFDDLILKLIAVVLQRHTFRAWFGSKSQTKTLRCFKAELLSPREQRAEIFRRRSIANSTPVDNWKRWQHAVRGSQGESQEEHVSRLFSVLVSKIRSGDGGIRVKVPSEVQLKRQDISWIVRLKGSWITHLDLSGQVSLSETEWRELEKLRNLRVLIVDKSNIPVRVVQTLLGNSPQGDDNLTMLEVRGCEHFSPTTSDAHGLAFQ